MSRSRPGRVLLATRIFAPEAAAATFRLGALARALAERAEVRVLTTAAPPHLRGAVTGDTAGVQLSRWPVLRDASGYVRGYLPYLSFDLPLALRLLTAPRPDVVVVEPPPTTGAVVRAVTALRRVPYVYYAADVWSDATASMGAPAVVVGAMRAVEGYALRGARDVVAVSDGVADRVRSLLRRPAGVRVHVVPNGIDTEVFTPDGERHPEAPGTPYLVYAGTASEWQGAEVFAEAMREVVAEEPSARLVFLGQGSSWPVLARIRDELPDGAIELRPLVPPTEAAAWLRGAAAALVSVRPGVGYDFAYPTKVIAALAAGAPVVLAGPGPAAADVLEHGLGAAVEHDPRPVAAAMLAAVRADGPDEAERARRVAWVREHRSLSATGEAAADVVLAYRPRMSDKHDDTVDRELLGLYLADHVSVAAAGLGRVEQMCQAHADLPIHADLVRTRDELREELDRLRGLVDLLGTRPRRVRQVVARVGERVGRLKLNRRLTGRSPMTPLLELDLLRGAVTGRQGLWQVLEEYAEPLGLDPAELGRRAREADGRRERLARMHGQLRAASFRAP